MFASHIIWLEANVHAHIDTMSQIMDLMARLFWQRGAVAQGAWMTTRIKARPVSDSYV